MLDDVTLQEALERHWEHSGKDEDISHEIYHDDAVLEFPQSGERFEGVENFREWRDIMDGWEAAEWPSPWRSETPADPPVT